jgi:cell division inhibitor SulA
MNAMVSLPLQDFAKPLQLTEIVQHSAQADSDALLLPMLAGLSQRESWLVLLEPPKSLDKQRLQAAGVDLKRVWILRRDERHGIDLLAQRALQAGTCHTLICWHQRESDDALVEQLKSTEVDSETQCLLIRKLH